MIKWKLELKETRRNCACCEATPRYDVILNGAPVGQLYFNMRGYVGSLPTPRGASLNMPEGGISSFKREVGRLNREAREYRHSAMESDWNAPRVGHKA